VELKSEVLTVEELLELKKGSMLIVNAEYQRGRFGTKLNRRD